MILVGDCIEHMRTLPDNSVDAVITDPPYNLEFMSKGWDSFRGEPVDPAFLHWFAGFVDGEGCFSVHKKKVNGYETYDCQFSITLRADDRPILERIHRTLGIGTLSKPTAHRTELGNPKARYSVSAKAQLVALRDIFRGYPLRAKKALDFETWSDALDAWLAHEPGDWKDMAEARDALMASREFVEEGVRVDPFQLWCWRWSREALRVLKPGGHLLAFGGTRTYHRLASGIEDAGFEIRDQIAYMYGSGFPKSLDVSKAIDAAAGAEREVIGERAAHTASAAWREREGRADRLTPPAITAPATEAARQWDGWGTALKPAYEPIVVARKPLAGTVAATVLAHGTGALNIDGCRVAMTADDADAINAKHAGMDADAYVRAPGAALRLSTDPIGLKPAEAHTLGRWPANVTLGHSDDCVLIGTRRVRGSHATGDAPRGRAGEGWGFGGGRGHILDSRLGPDGLEAVEAWDCAPDCPVRILDEQSGERPGRFATRGEAQEHHVFSGGWGERPDEPRGYGDSGGASRFFYTAKASRAEREAGLDALPMQRFAQSGGGQTDAATGDERYEDSTIGLNVVKDVRNVHPTVKPVAVMRWLVRLVTPPGGTVLDPFTGSGTTGIACALEGFQFVGVEQSEDYAAIAESRIAYWEEHGEQALRVAAVAQTSERERREREEAGQLDLFAPGV